jgi:hypothetical protein
MKIEYTSIAMEDIIIVYFFFGNEVNTVERFFELFFELKFKVG